MKVEGDFYVRGGIHTTVTVEYQAGDKLKKKSPKNRKKK